MNIAAFHNRKVFIRENDFIHKNLKAHIVGVKEDSKKLLLILDAAIAIENVVYTHAIASPRLAKEHLADLIIPTKGVVGCAVTWIPQERFNRDDPFDISWWRGGAAAITDVVIQ